MNAKEVTFEILDGMKSGDRFSGYHLMLMVKHRTGDYHYADSMLRYMREYRVKRDRKILNVDKKKSIYEVQ